MNLKTYLSPVTGVLSLFFDKNFCLSGNGQTDKFIVEDDETDNLF